MFHHPLHLSIAVTAAGILHAVCRDDKDGFPGTVLFPGVFMHIGDMVYCTADCVQQSCTSTHKILAVCQRLYLPYVSAVIDDSIVIAEQHSRQNCIARCRFLLLHHRVEAADRVTFQSRHGTASVKDEYDFSKVFVHNKNLLSSLLFGLLIHLLIEV